MANIVIRSSYSAQPSTARPNPFVASSIDYIMNNQLVQKSARLIRAADQGCGKLRHLPILIARCHEVILVDTSEQLGRKQTIFSQNDITVPEYVASMGKGNRVEAIPAERFAKSALGLDIVFNVCAMDVEVPRIRRDMFHAAVRNLRLGGLLTVVAPRNDQTILVRCTPKNKYLDGHVFRHHGVVTFYRNFKRHAALVALGQENGLTLVADLSVYRQVCLIFRK